MLNQVIYTRCKPKLDLKNGGIVVNSEGFGVPAVSEELLKDHVMSNYDHLNDILISPNAAKEDMPIGLFNSYEYALLTPDSSAMVFEVARPHCKIPRITSTGRKSHRAGTFIKQGLIGRVEGYPFEWFGADAWDAYKTDENGYYFDDTDEHMSTLPQVKSSPSGGYITLEKVRDFVVDGRADVVKACLWFLLNEFEKPENERKVLLIKDLPENVELWIAAIDFGLSVDMAKQVTFSTNKKKDSKFFYFTDQRGNYSSTQNNAVSQERHPCNMIIGIHPKDGSPANIRTTPNGNYIVVNGENKTSDIQPDDSINRAYYSAVVQYEDNIRNFCRVLPVLQVKNIGTFIVDLFDAYEYLLCKDNSAEKWEYNETLWGFKVLKKHAELKDEEINKFLINEALKAYPHLAEADEDNGFRLFKLLADIAGVSGTKRDMAGFFFNMLYNELTHMGETECNLAHIWDTIRIARIEDLIKQALTELFVPEYLAIYRSLLRSAAKPSVCAILDMYLYSFRNTYKNNIYVNFVIECVWCLVTDEMMLNKAFDMLKDDPQLFFYVALSIGSHLKTVDPEKALAWWDKVIAFSGDNVNNLCKSICDKQLASIDTIEELLANRINREKKCDKNVLAAFSDAMKKLGINEHTGETLFGAWIEVTEPDKMVEVVDAIIEKTQLNKSVRIELFSIIDDLVTCSNLDKFKAEFFNAMHSLSKKLGITSAANELYNLKINMSRAQRIEDAVQVMNNFSKRKICMPDDMIGSNYFNFIASKASRFNDKGINLLFMKLFIIDDKTVLQKYSDHYVKELFKGKSGKSLAMAMLSVSEASAVKYKRIGSPNTESDDAVKVALNASLKDLIPKYYKANLIGYISKDKDADETAKTNLIMLLRESGESANHNPGLFGIIGGVFKKK